MIESKRIQEIEDRKIEILMEISSINRNYRDRLDHLNEEYEFLNRELYEIRIKLITMDEKEVVINEEEKERQ